MKKIHHKSLKFHTIYSVVLSVVFLLIIVLINQATLAATMIFLLLYIIGNGIIHTRKNELTRDAVIEYILVSIIVLIVILGAINK